MKTATKKIVYTALCIAVGVLLPQLFHLTGIPDAGSVFCPMHLPVLLCGFMCGPVFGGFCGLAVPLLSSFTGMPPIFPVGVVMMAELCAYGILAGVLYKAFKEKVMPALVLAMLGGRIVMGLANVLIYTNGSLSFVYSWPVFLTSAFVTALPGIIIMLVLIPVLLFALKKAKLLPL
ncbi:MAG: ECF transporter S component [Christensenellaceae bacterium]|nr:ECF transporter S component [Christensenellaceae bacterium]